MTSDRALRMETNRGCRNRRSNNNRESLRIIRRSEDVASGIGDVNGCGTNRNIGEVVVTIGISCGGANNTVNIGEGNGTSREISIGSILDAVVVGITKHVTGNGALGLEANRGCRCRGAHSDGNILWIVCGREGMACWIGGIH